jgi:hypothetical protein
MQVDALQRIDQTGVGIDLMQPAGARQALDDADMFCPHVTPA